MLFLIYLELENSIAALKEDNDKLKKLISSDKDTGSDDEPHKIIDDLQ